MKPSHLNLPIQTLVAVICDECKFALSCQFDTIAAFDFCPNCTKKLDAEIAKKNKQNQDK